MENKLAKIISDIEKNNKVNYNSIFIRKDISDLDVLGTIIYCLKNNVDDVNESYDLNYADIENTYFNDGEIEDYLKNYNETEEDYLDDVLNEFVKIAIHESIKNTKINFSFNDVKQEALFSIIKFKNEYYDKLSKNYDKEFLKNVLRLFVRRALISYQYNELSIYSEQEYLSLLYIKIVSEVNEGENLDDILNRVGINKEYYEKLARVYENKDFSLSYDDIKEETERVKRKYEIALNTNRLTFLEETVLSMYLGLDGEKLSISDIAKKNDTNKENIQELINLSIMKLSLIFNMDILDYLERIQTDLEGINDKLI
ncbi:hypothetical protein [Streptobacillus moniliformis]|uniref:Uncharacterized protein n=1 Tax=Streptobacillus moniliformis (strain ATCC 14647 / DSM 12112 / NCTC 10651 / 9901) TaxID=519441 RepID=D1AV13_STRM9|nr:hypothetical protein [Streptobacillus moniliformis]ACZ01573.1 hypothetical protein Smon_1112 [Streptobacillus moniliformis DSM 12112]AVL43431.1 hypothetical protein CEP89_06285 [Streptobacillus moniliformis]SQA13259.1 Uncharacterised protein [Streptobacillus moniliformis]